MIIGHKLRVENPADVRLRLDTWLQKRFPSSKRSWIKDAIERGDILLNERPCAKGAKVRAGDRIEVVRLPESVDHIVRSDPAVKLNIRLADDTILALSKPAGIPVHPLSPEETGTLANGLVAAYPDLQSIGEDPLFPALVHRIDTDTSGLVLAARTPQAYAALREQFKTRKVVKVYTALVRGTPPVRGRLEHRLEHQPGRRGVMRVLDDPAPSSKANCFPAVTEYSVMKRYGAYSLLRVRIFTGVTHQIRCQLAYAGYPLVGDKVYGPRRASAIARHFLHATHLEFQHPKTGARVRVDDPLPPDLQAFLEELEPR